LTDEERRQEGAEDEIEDLEAPGAAQQDVAGGLGPCRPTNDCAPNNTLITHCELPTQKCTYPGVTCLATVVREA
jgi:hypothetical protein